ncbi:12880_t:CDS:2 [Funneliformis geosporum]|uniref:12880_t:CDS:1 n=1 Tax=Funneliformis geosporum TaxID=1117311 RepID=A0A9W4T134_9GLOM|nr:12880_t:CDS:2 [Funneliformis geosporum]
MSRGRSPPKKSPNRRPPPKRRKRRNCIRYRDFPPPTPSTSLAEFLSGAFYCLIFLIIINFFYKCLWAYSRA